MPPASPLPCPHPPPLPSTYTRTQLAHTTHAHTHTQHNTHTPPACRAKPAAKTAIAAEQPAELEPSEADELRIFYGTLTGTAKVSSSFSLSFSLLLSLSLSLSRERESVGLCRCRYRNRCCCRLFSSHERASPAETPLTRARVEGTALFVSQQRRIRARRRNAAWTKRASSRHTASPKPALPPPCAAQSFAQQLAAAAEKQGTAKVTVATLTGYDVEQLAVRPVCTLVATAAHASQQSNHSPPPSYLSPA